MLASGPTISTPSFFTLSENSPFGLENVPDVCALQTYAVDPAASVIAAPPAGQFESPVESGATVGLTPFFPLLFQVTCVSSCVQ
jgi:hypothetical protein